MNETTERALLELEDLARKMGDEWDYERVRDANMIFNCVCILRRALERAC